MNKSVYISAPVQLNWGTVLKYVAHIDNKFNVKIWDRCSKYNNHDLKKSDIFLLLTKENAWHIETKYLPSGCKRELDQAIELNKPIYLGYQTKDGNIAVYEASLSYGRLSGIQGTGNSILRIEDDTIEHTEIDLQNPNEFDIALEEIYHSFADKRLLLI